MLYQDDEGRQFRGYKWDGTAEGVRKIEKEFDVKISMGFEGFLVYFPKSKLSEACSKPSLWLIFYHDPMDGSFSYMFEREFNKIYTPARAD